MSTETLNSTATAALSRLEAAFLPMPLDVVRAVARYEVAAARYDELIARPASSLSPAEFDAIGQAQQTLAEAFGVLAEAGRVDLVEAPVDPAARLEVAQAECRRLSASAVTTADYDRLLCLQDELAFCRCQAAVLGAVA